MDPRLFFDFVHVARHGGLRAGAKASGPSASTLARHVAELEAEMGVRLIDRDERSFVLTTAGRTLLDRLQGPVAAIVDAVDRTAAEAGFLRGALRVSAPVIFAHSHLARIAAGFSLDNPAIDLEIVADDRLVDPVAENFDLLIRANPDPTGRLVGRRLFITDRVAVAAPVVPVPQDHEEARLVFRVGDAIPRSWSLRTGTASRSIRLRPALALSTLLMVRDAVLAGAGTALLPRSLVGSDLDAGTLTEWGVLSDAKTEVWVLRTGHGQPSPKVAAFIRYLGNTVGRSQVSSA